MSKSKLSTIIRREIFSPIWSKEFNPRTEKFFVTDDRYDKQNMEVHYVIVEQSEKLVGDGNENNDASGDRSDIFADYLEAVIQTQWSIFKSFHTDFCQRVVYKFLRASPNGSKE